MLKKLVILVTAPAIKTRIWLLVLAVLIAPGILGSNIVLDGTLSSDEWDGSLSFDLEYELMPSRNTPAALKTTAYVQYDEKYLYIGIKAYGDPAKIRSTLKNRDCLLYTSPSPRDGLLSRMPSSA